MNMNTLSDFLDQSKCQYQIYDLGRKVTKIDNGDFKKIEHNEAPYPYPIQLHAFMAITFWRSSKAQEHFIWFLKMPIDEQGFIKISAQTSFIKMVIEAMGKDLTADVSKDLQERLASNPFLFKPNTEKLAILNAKLNIDFVRPASSFYQDSVDYFSGATSWDEWQNLGFQGIADLTTRLSYDNNQQHLINALPFLPQQPLQSLVLCLEHQSISADLAGVLSQQAEQSADEERAILFLRSLAGYPAIDITKALLEKQLNSNLIHNANWYITIAGRLWHTLTDETLLNRFLEALANHQAPLFTPLFSDLVAIPLLRDKVLKQLRLPARSPALSQAIGSLFASTKEEASKVAQN